MKAIVIEIDCGEKTCASSPGNFCQFFRQRIDGSEPRCCLFGKLLFDDKKAITGWLMRLPECLAIEIKERETLSE